MSTEETTTTKKSKEEAKKRTKEIPEAVEKARRKVVRHVEEGKPGATSEHVDSSHGTKPSE